MTGGGHSALVTIVHEAIDRRDVQEALRRRWPDLALKSLEHEEPAVSMTAKGAADLGQRRRGVESLRIVIMPQPDRQTSTLLV
jgi:hypothetical protein